MRKIINTLMILPIVFGNLGAGFQFQNTESYKTKVVLPSGPKQTIIQKSYVAQNDYYKGSPATYGDWIVWDDYRSETDFDIYAYNMATEESRAVCTKDGDQYNPDIYGNKVVWMDTRNGNSDIYMYDLETYEETAVCTNVAGQYSPSISNSLIVWEDARNSTGSSGGERSDIYAWDFNTSSEIPICTSSGASYSPKVNKEASNDDYVVYIDLRTSGWEGANIYGYDVSEDTETLLSTNDPTDAYFEWSPYVYGNLVAWTLYDYEGTNSGVYSKDLSSGTVTKRISNTSDYNYSASAVYDDKILYGKTEVPVITSVKSLNKKIGFNKSVVQGGGPSGPTDVYTYDISDSVTKKIGITNNDDAKFYADTYVWTGDMTEGSGSGTVGGSVQGGTGDVIDGICIAKVYTYSVDSFSNITPTSPVAGIEDATSTFTIKNHSYGNLPIDSIGTAVRYGTSNKNFTPDTTELITSVRSGSVTGLTVPSGDTYTYTGVRKFSNLGAHTYWGYFYINGTGYLLSSKKSFTTVPVTAKVKVISHGMTPSSKQPWEWVVSTFTIKNDMNCPITLSSLGTAVRYGTTNRNFPAVSNVTIASGGTYKYSRGRTFGYLGTYKYWFYYYTGGEGYRVSTYKYFDVTR